MASPTELPLLKRVPATIGALFLILRHVRELLAWHQMSLVTRFAFPEGGSQSYVFRTCVQVSGDMWHFLPPPDPPDPDLAASWQEEYGNNLDSHMAMLESTGTKILAIRYLPLLLSTGLSGSGVLGHLSLDPTGMQWFEWLAHGAGLGATVYLRRFLARQVVQALVVLVKQWSRNRAVRWFKAKLGM